MKTLKWTALVVWCLIVFCATLYVTAPDALAELTTWNLDYTFANSCTANCCEECGDVCPPRCPPTKARAKITQNGDDLTEIEALIINTKWCPSSKYVIAIGVGGKCPECEVYYNKWGVTSAQYDTNATGTWALKGFDYTTAPPIGLNEWIDQHQAQGHHPQWVFRYVVNHDDCGNCGGEGDVELRVTAD